MRQSLLISGGSLGIFVERPICQTLLALAALTILGLLWSRRARPRARVEGTGAAP